MKELIVVTGASSNHFHCLRNLLYSISFFEPKSRTIIYDLGLCEEQAGQLKHWELRRFPFENHPRHLDIRRRQGCYAWKPVIIAETLCEGEAILWLDAGNLIHKPLDRVRSVLADQGIYSPKSSGTVQQWTHLGTLEYLQASPDLHTRGNRNAAIVGLAAGYRGVKELAERWKMCALDVNCIAPPGSNRSNHRQDQAVLTVLMYQFQQQHGYTFVDERLDITTHNDGRSSEEVRALLAVGV